MSVQAAPKTEPAFVIVDTPDSTAIIQPGHPTTQASAYTIDVDYAGTSATDQELDAAVTAWVQANALPLNSNVYATLLANTATYTLATTLTRT